MQSKIIESINKSIERDYNSQLPKNMLILLNPENKQSFEDGHLGGCNIKGDPALELIKTWRADTSADRK